MTWNRFLRSVFAIAVGSVLLPTAHAQFLQDGNKLSGSDAVGQSEQGVAVALSFDGNTAIVGGTGDINQGAFNGSVWIYTRAGGSWVQQGTKLVGTGSVGPYEGQGSSVAISADGSTALVGAPGDNDLAGATWVFTRSGGSWRQQGSKLVGTGAVGQARQGISVALSADGNTAILGGTYDNNEAGAVWVFTRTGSMWLQQGGKIVGNGAAGAAGQGRVAVSADGNTVVVGGPGDDNRGALWVFTRAGATWSQQGDKIVAPDAGINLGSSVALSSDGQTIIAGAPYDAGQTGAAWVFTQTSGVWARQSGKLVGSRSLLLAENQGSSVAVCADGNTAVVGGPVGHGAAWVFARTGEAWTQVGDPLVGADAAKASIPSEGFSVAIAGDGNTIAVGGPLDAGYKGAAWVYKHSSNPFILTGGVVNGASFLPGIAPGAWITIEGLNLSATTRIWQDSDFSGNNLPTQLDGVQVSVNGKPAYVYYVSPTQLNVLAPDDAVTGPVPVQVTNAMGASNLVSATEAELSPAMFALNAPAGNYVAAVRSDGVYLGPDTPARPGDIVLLYGTGFGPTTPVEPIGQLISPAPVSNDVRVQIGGVTAATSFSGLVSPGLYQFNVVIPNVPDGDRPVSVAVGNSVSQPSLLLPVRQ